MATNGLARTTELCRRRAEPSETAATAAAAARGAATEATALPRNAGWYRLPVTCLATTAARAGLSLCVAAPAAARAETMQGLT
mmetsp:Transcript_69407/g.111905  ORF Transcript_69407/g.111905 Transcript_69407/m.111905 type:complete len:83 (-) Transcript_69407:68-316(-)